MTISNALSKMVLVASLLTATAAHADGDYWRHRHDGYRGGSWVAPLVGGLIIGGIVAGSVAHEDGEFYDEGRPYLVCHWERAFDAYGNYIGNRKVCYNR